MAQPGGRPPLRSMSYGPDVLAPQPRRPVELPRVPAERGLVVEDGAGQFCGAVMFCEKDAVTLEDRHGKRRVFPLDEVFLLDGQRVRLVRPGPARPGGPGSDRLGLGRRPGEPGQGRAGQPDLRRGPPRRRAGREDLGR